MIPEKSYVKEFGDVGRRGRGAKAVRIEFSFELMDTSRPGL